MTNQVQSNSPIILNSCPGAIVFSSGTTANAYTIFSTTTATSLNVNGNWNHGYTHSYIKPLEDGDPLVTIVCEDDEVFCVKFLYDDEETCQEIPEDFDRDFDCLFELSIKLFPRQFQTLLYGMSGADRLIKMVYTIDGREHEITVQELETLITA